MLIISLYLLCGRATAGEVLKWEFGMGLGGLSIPHYRGSDQREEYIGPIPYVRYNGERLKVDREGGRYYFIERERLKLDASFAFYPPVDSEDNLARQGMPDLDFVFEIGPRLQYNIFESDDNKVRFRAALPLRAAIATDVEHTESIGWVFSPYLQLRVTHGLESAVSLGPIWASEPYHAYFYEVSPAYVTSNRPAYNAHGGYSGTRITFTTSYRYKDLWLGLFARYDNLSGATFDESPLVKRDDAFMVGLAAAWVFKKSSSRVSLQ